MKTENFIESVYRELVTIDTQFISLYKEFNHEKLENIFSTLHEKILSSFEMMNRRLPTKNEEAYYWAEPSRTLIDSIGTINKMYTYLETTNYAFAIDEYYNEIFAKCLSFLVYYHGSQIPPNMDKIELYYTIPILSPTSSLKIVREEKSSFYKLKLIGEGSYANVYKYKDDFYNKNFVIKRAKKGLSEKELLRFKREYEEMEKFSSPYIVEVYTFNELDNEYVMEFMDSSLYDFIKDNNQKLDYQVRKRIVFQILEAFRYIHSKGLLHRDISPKNILIKKYEDTLVVKIADFGLVKVPDSSLTSIHTTFKGYFNDPVLEHIGFDNYDMEHEVYALTRIIFFVMTGKTNIESIKEEKIRKFIQVGMNPDKKTRYKSVDEIFTGFKKAF